MNFIHGLILGAIQGVTEWLPVSSQGVISLVLINVFDLPPAEAVILAIWLHSGTLLAAIFYFRREIIETIRHLPAYTRNIRQSGTTPQGNLITFLLLATAVSGVIGGPLLILSLDRLKFPGSLVTAIIGLFLIVTGLVQRFAMRAKDVADKPLTIKDSLILGAVQALSVFPGLSRSGLTVATLLFRRYNGAQALKLSFLLSIPLILVAQVGLGLLGKVRFTPVTMAGVLSSMFFGFLTISGLMKFAMKVPFWGFCIFLGLLSLLTWLLSL